MAVSAAFFCAVVAIASGRAAARAHPLPPALFVVDAVLGQEHRGVAGDVGAQALQHRLDIVRMDLVVGVQVDLHVEVVAAARLDLDFLQFVALQVVLPVELVGGPQRQPELFLAFAHRPQVLALVAFAAAMPGQQHAGQQQHQQCEQQGHVVRRRHPASVGKRAGAQQASRPARLLHCASRIESACVSETDLPGWDDVAAAADQLGLASTPAELHGGLCGWLAGGGGDSRSWPALVLADPLLPAPANGDALDRLRTASAAQLADTDFGFELLLPDEGQVIERAGGMFAWCRAFLGGFGLSVGEKKLSDEGEEALGDIANLAAARVDDVDPEGDEESLTEIEEYVRMAVLLLHADCAMGPRHRQRLH